MVIQTARVRPSRRLPLRGCIDLPERIRYLLTDRLGRGIGRAEFPVAMACRVSINASCKRICLKWVNRVGLRVLYARPLKTNGQTLSILIRPFEGCQELKSLCGAIPKRSAMRRAVCSRCSVTAR
jgi:hypothetical protein